MSPVSAVSDLLPYIVLTTIKFRAWTPVPLLYLKNLPPLTILSDFQVPHQYYSVHSSIASEL